MARKKPRAAGKFFEPWRAAQSTTWQGGFTFEPREPEDPDDTLAWERYWRWHNDRARAERDADWLLWGTGMMPEEQATGGTSGQRMTVGTERIVAHVRNLVADGGPGKEKIAKRIAACVNGCISLKDPEKQVRKLIDLVSILSDPDSDKALRERAEFEGVMLIKEIAKHERATSDVPEADAVVP